MSFIFVKVNRYVPFCCSSHNRLFLGEDDEVNVFTVCSSSSVIQTVCTTTSLTVRKEKRLTACSARISFLSK